MVPNVKPALDPLAQRAAIQALEAQRAAYRRFAAAAGGQQRALGTGDGEQATRAADIVELGYAELDAGAKHLAPLVSAVHETGTADQLDEMQRHMTDLMSEAQNAEAAIQNLSTQLEAWRDAYGRQLADQGIVPGTAGSASGTGSSSGTTDGAASDAAARSASGRGSHGSYGPRGSRPDARGIPSLLDRKG